MIAYLEEMIARLFGARQEQPVRVRADDARPQDRQLRGRR
tara:strand:- start:182 stop:301 length:120 start_codon:yes stop_codon:yes gene_type:complete